MVCLCSIRVLINELDGGPQNSELEFWLYQGFYPRLFHTSLILLLAILALGMTLADLGTATV